MPVKNTFGARLMGLILEKGWDQTFFAKVTEITPAAISHYIKGDRNPNLKTVKIMANALGTTMEYLLSGTPKPR